MTCPQCGSSEARTFKYTETFLGLDFPHIDEDILCPSCGFYEHKTLTLDGTPISGSFTKFPTEVIKKKIRDRERAIERGILKAIVGS